MHNVDAIVIGAGINGASIAYNLAKRGYKNVAIVERSTIASGGTGKSAAIVRQHYSNEVLIRMVKRSRDVFEFFADEIGGSAGFVKTGWLFFVPDQVVEGFKKNIEMQKKFGIKTSVVSKDEALQIAPQVDPTDAAGIAYEPDSGYADPYESTVSYIHAARALGARLFQSSPVQAIRLNNGKIAGVVTAKAEFSTRIVVNASGPWANVIGKMVGLSYPIQVTREQEVLLRPQKPTDCPKVSVSDMCNAIYFHPFGKELLVGRGFPKEYEEVDPDNYREGSDSEFLEEAAERVAKRIPAMASAMILKGYSGLYDVTPDWHPIICGHPELEGFFTAVGFSGHGFKLAPAVGEALAELITTGKNTIIDLSPFRAERFATGEVFTAAYGGNRA
ncbi:MAG TPA: FAD-dependent oxidoreductase [Candidatus Dormibacteraeota bacterium]|nr:FAD-dependent oxidoreductase [Candidatus Dormibacteraeota bacterium]